jgi:hypothetical protein
MTRKTPIRHTVKSHTRQGVPIDSYERGKGNRPKKRNRTRPRRVVGATANSRSFTVRLDGQVFPVKARGFTEAAREAFDEYRGDSPAVLVIMRR